MRDILTESKGLVRTTFLCTSACDTNIYLTVVLSGLTLT